MTKLLLDKFFLTRVSSLCFSIFQILILDICSMHNLHFSSFRLNLILFSFTFLLIETIITCFLSPILASIFNIFIAMLFVCLFSKIKSNNNFYILIVSTFILQLLNLLFTFAIISTTQISSLLLVLFHIGFVIFLLILYVIFVVKILYFHDMKIILENEQISYNCLSDSYDTIRSFKHDFSNIMQSIGGYLVTDDLNGLKSYYSSIYKDCNELKQLSMLNKDILNSPPVLSLISSKYDKAKKLGVDFNIDVLVDLNCLNIDIYEFTRILGIFLDNSIEAASSSSTKIINVMITKDSRNHFDMITVENSCDSSNIDILKIFEKDFSTKANNTGLGLWRVKNILNKYDNVVLNTFLKDNLFTHQLRIYY